MDDCSIGFRLKVFMDAVGLSSSQLADNCGIARPSLSQILSGRNKKVSDVLLRQIHAAYPDLNIMWLLCGEGDMLLSKNDSNPDSAEFSHIACDFEDAPPYGSGEEGPSGGSGAPLQADENPEFPGNGAATDSHAILSGLAEGRKTSQTRMNNGVEDDLRTVALMRQIEKLRENPRKVTQITIYYDDSTFETFFPEVKNIQ